MTMRAALKEALYKSGSRKDWSHITEETGMFCYSGLTPEQVERLKVEHHVYITRDGRISMAELTSCNVRYVAEAIHSVTEERGKHGRSSHLSTVPWQGLSSRDSQ